MLLSHVHAPVLPFFSPRKTKSAALEGSQAPRAPSFVTFQTSEGPAGSEGLLDGLSSGELSLCSFCLLYN